MHKTSLVLAALLAVAGICVMLWPVFTGNRLQSSAATAVQEFLADRDDPEQQYPELLAALQEYNCRLYTEKQCNLTDLEACETPAADLTAYGVEDEIIGVLEIPAMELTMPVYLGASDAHLAAGAAVLGNTSAPIGGDDTNCVRTRLLVEAEQVCYTLTCVFVYREESHVLYRRRSICNYWPAQRLFGAGTRQ